VHLDSDKQSAAHNTWYKKLPGYRVIQGLHPAPNFLYVDKELLANGNFSYHQTLWATETDGTCSETRSLEKELIGDNLMPC
jgi:hypothetical protein